MKISSINKNNNIFFSPFYSGFQRVNSNNVFEKKNPNLSSFSALNVRANYCPTFGKYRKVANVTLIDKDTGKEVVASLRKDTMGDFIDYQLLVNRNEVGFMKMNCDSKFMNEINLPEITHLRTLQGDKYQGIGTALVNAAVSESFKKGYSGSVFLVAETGYARTFSSYRSNENPIPFYHKLGFVSPFPDIEEKIQDCIKKTDYKKLPTSELLLLPPEAINEKNKYFANRFEIL